MSMADRMAIFMNGRIVQQGAPEEIFRRPASISVANFLGNPAMNLLPARLEAGVAHLGRASFPVPGLSHLGSRDVILGVRPSEIVVREGGTTATVTMREVLGEDVILDLSLGDQLVRAKFPAAQRLAEGDRVPLHFDVSSLHVFDRTTELRLEV